MSFLEGFVSQWDKVLERMPQDLGALGEVAGFVSLVVVATCVLVFGFGGVVCLLSRGHSKPETEIEAEVRRMRRSAHEPI
jgi:hypothetical protein